MGKKKDEKIGVPKGAAMGAAAGAGLAGVIKILGAIIGSKK